MPFKIKDLMIDIATTADREVPNLACWRPTYLCYYGTLQHCPNHSCQLFTCPGPSRVECPFASGQTILYMGVCGISERPTDPGPVDLGSLKEQLRAQLAEIETHERAAEAAARPQTREQAAELEEKLKAALEEVQSLKKNLPSRD